MNEDGYEKGVAGVLACVYYRRQDKWLHCVISVSWQAMLSAFKVFPLSSLK